jgi:hypothetical protein
VSGELWFPAPPATAHDGYALIVCSCDDGPYIGARKAGTPCCCEVCGFITQDQLDAVLAPDTGAGRVMGEREDTEALTEVLAAHRAASFFGTIGLQDPRDAGWYCTCRAKIAENAKWRAEPLAQHQAEMLAAHVRARVAAALAPIEALADELDAEAAACPPTTQWGDHGKRFALERAARGIRAALPDPQGDGGPT